MNFDLFDDPSDLPQTPSVVHGKTFRVASGNAFLVEESGEETGLSCLPEVQEGFYVMPNSLVRGSNLGTLFNARKGTKDDRYAITGKVIADNRHCKLTYTGLELRQAELDVFIGVLHLASSTSHDLRKPLVFTAPRFLKSIGWVQEDKHPSKKDYDRLTDSLKALASAKIYVEQYRSIGPNERIPVGEFSGGNLLAEFKWRKEGASRHYEVNLDPKIALIFTKNEYTIGSHSLRRELDGRQPLAKMLLEYYLTSREPIPISIYELAARAGLCMTHKNTFRRVFVAACEHLVKINFLESFHIDDQKRLHVKRQPLKRIAPSSGAIYNNVYVDNVVDAILKKVTPVQMS